MRTQIHLDPLRFTETAELTISFQSTDPTDLDLQLPVARQILTVALNGRVVLDKDGSQRIVQAELFSSVEACSLEA